MSNSFIQKWHAIRTEKQSNIVAGLDPAVYEIGHGEKGLPKEVDLLEWSISFINAVSPYVAAVKVNQGFFQGVGQRQALEQIVHHIHKNGLLALSDNKIADIGNTNNAWVFYNKKLGFDALTCAPYAGNIEEIVSAAHEKDMGICTMGLMSNPEFKSEMHFVHPDTGEALWKNRVQRSLNAGADGIVVGGTYTKKDKEFTECISLTDESSLLYLVPGIGAQGGDIASFLESGINPEKCMICSSRGVMFPNGSHSTKNEQAQAAQSLQELFNKEAY